MKGAWIAVAALAASLALAQSQPPPPAPTKTSDEPQQKPQHESRNANEPSAPSDKQSPVVVTAPPSIYFETADQKRDTDKNSSERWVVLGIIFNGSLVGVAVLQWLTYRRQAGIMERQTNILRAQQEDSQSLERPFVYGAVSKPGLSVADTFIAPRFEPKPFEISIYNFGRTPAILNRIKHVVSIAEKGGIAEAIDPGMVGGRELPTGIAAINGIPYSETENIALRFLDDHQDIANLKKTVWVVGFVRYMDVFNRHYISGFAECFSVVSGRWVRRGSEKYNYAREEAPGSIPPPSSRG